MQYHFFLFKHGTLHVLGTKFRNKSSGNYSPEYGTFRRIPCRIP